MSETGDIKGIILLSTNDLDSGVVATLLLPWLQWQIMVWCLCSYCCNGSLVSFKFSLQSPFSISQVLLPSNFFFITNDQIKAKITVFFPLLRLHRLPKAWNKQDFWPWSEAAALFISSWPTARVFHSFLISPSLPSPLSYFSCTCGRH